MSVAPVTKSDYKTYLKTLNRVTMQVFSAMIAERNDLASKYNSLSKSYAEVAKDSKKPFEGASKVDDLSMSEVTIGMSKDNVSIPFAAFMKDQTSNLVGILSKSRNEGGLVSGAAKRERRVTNIHTGDRAREVFGGLRDILADLGVDREALRAVDSANKEIVEKKAFANVYLSKLLSMISYLAKDSVRGNDVEDPRGFVVLPDGLSSLSENAVQNVHFTRKFVDAVLGAGSFESYRQERIRALRAKIGSTSDAKTRSKLEKSLANVRSDDGERYLAFLQTLQLFQKTARHENYDKLSKLSKAVKHQTERNTLKAPLDIIANAATPKQNAFVSIVEGVSEARSPRTKKKRTTRA